MLPATDAVTAPKQYEIQFSMLSQLSDRALSGTAKMPVHGTKQWAVFAPKRGQAAAIIPEHGCVPGFPSSTTRRCFTRSYEEKGLAGLFGTILAALFGKGLPILRAENDWNHR